MREININIRLSEAEKQSLQLVASRYNLDMAKLIRAAINLVAETRPELRAAHTEKILPVSN